MAKVFGYMILFTGILFILTAAGLPTAGSAILDGLGLSFGDISGFRAGALVTTLIVAALGSLAITGSGQTIVGTIGQGIRTVAILAAYITPLLAVVIDGVAIIIAAGTAWTGFLVGAIMIPLMAGYIIAIVDWVRGTG